MLPGYLHFDVRRGLRADLLVAAMMPLVEDSARLKKIIDSLQVEGLHFLVNNKTIFGINGQQVSFVLNERVIAREQPNSDVTAPVFDSPVCLDELREWIIKKKLDVSVEALVLKILEQLQISALSSHLLSPSDALWLICHAVMLSAQIHVIDPKFISATKICTAEDGHPSSWDKTISLHDRLWINHVLIGMPVMEVRDEIEIDVVALAFIKTLAGHIGARGEGTIMKIGMGVSEGVVHTKPIVVEALFCEASIPESMIETGPTNRPRIVSLHEITAAMLATYDMVQMSSTMSLHGAHSITWHLVQREKNLSCYLVRFLVTDDDKRDAIEALLIKFAAFDVTISVVERHEVNRRLVSVPLGTGNKTTSVRFYEYVYYDKIVRVEPAKEDLEHYVQKTDYSVDVARSDLLFAWKKWRGRVVSEDA